MDTHIAIIDWSDFGVQRTCSTTVFQDVWVSDEFDEPKTTDSEGRLTETGELRELMVGRQGCDED